VIFLCSYTGIGISFFPYLIPNQLTIWQAAAPATTLRFILVGVAIMLPILFAYTLYAYYVFRGKTKNGYH
jgi:cytochrome d ubiquinol oxidase subunit II